VAASHDAPAVDDHEQGAARDQCARRAVDEVREVFRQVRGQLPARLTGCRVEREQPDSTSALALPMTARNEFQASLVASLPLLLRWILS
jgi:hypothetical protein